MKRFAIVVFALAGLVLAAGCGGPSDEEQIQEVSAAFTAAMSDQDQQGACDQFTPAFDAEWDMGSGYGCGKSFGPIGNPDDWTGLEIESIDIQDDDAAVLFEDFYGRAAAADKLYGKWLGCDLFNECGPKLKKYNLAAILQAISLEKTEEGWRINDVAVEQPG